MPEFFRHGRCSKFFLFHYVDADFVGKNEAEGEGYEAEGGECWPWEVDDGVGEISEVGHHGKPVKHDDGGEDETNNNHDDHAGAGILEFELHGNEEAGHKQTDADGPKGGQEDGFHFPIRHKEGADQKAKYCNGAEEESGQKGK